MIVEYIGPKRILSEVPRKSDSIYDENLGRTKPVTIHWRVEQEDRIVSQNLDDGLAFKIMKSPMNPQGSKYFVEYNPEERPDVYMVPLASGDAMLLEENAKLRAALQESNKKRLNMSSAPGKFANGAAEEPSTKTAEKEKLSPVKKGAVDRLATRLTGKGK